MERAEPMLVRNARLADKTELQDVLAIDGRIVAIGPGLAAPEGARIVEAEGLLLSPPFVDPHFHMDATLSYGLPRVNESGTLLEGIALWGERKPTLKAEQVIERALAYCDWAVAPRPAGDPQPRGHLHVAGRSGAVVFQPPRADG